MLGKCCRVARRVYYLPIRSGGVTLPVLSIYCIVMIQCLPAGLAWHDWRPDDWDYITWFGPG